ncbi:tyrosine-type recombinase/integrase [Halobacillus naozhouensis]|uniref:Tyrosine-type recombinase/integrase n=1 Tax=Halobacillus naozhouensis TaxID=554880 RepID=A0ABY8J0C7_9BACI|nr:tyrosine-type recombinase/integrase [Halobacillus naozhouensis]WFT74873.1 tyrosine-type recombinase/integrase [Halobacillus naozhouensis]
MVKAKSNRKGKAIVKRRTAPQNLRQVFTDNTINLSLEDALEYVYAFKQSEGLRERTLSDHRNLFVYFIEWAAEFYPDVEQVNDVTSGVIRQYIIYLSEERVNKRTGELGLSPYTVNIRIRQLKTFFSVLHSEEIIDKNPMKGVKLLKVDEDKFTPLTEKEIDRLLKAPDVKEYAQFRDLCAIFLTLDTGIRVSELFSLEMADLDFKSRAIYLPGRKTKNRKPRVLPLSNQVLRLLMELITEVKANFETDYVFVSNFGEPYSPTSFRRRVHIYKTRAGIEKPLSAHSLRHQFCRDYILNGGDLFSLQRIAGHASISTTRKYIQFTTEDLQKQHAQYSPITKLRRKYRKS